MSSARSLPPSRSRGRARMSLESRCANCAAQVTGRFCGHCGQRLESPIHSVGHFVAEATEDLTHLDSRAWATLRALLFKPGFLTRKFLDGQRARYLPPVRLYLVLSLVFFLVATLLPPSGAWIIAMSVNDSGATRPVAGTAQGPQQDSVSALGRRERENICARIQVPPGSTLVAAMKNACFRDNGRTLHDAVFHAVSRAMFVFLPLLALVMMALYWRPRHFYVEHLLLLIHNHACVFLALTFWELVRHVIPWLRVDTALTLALGVYIGWYVYKSMRVVYGQGRWLTVAKMGVMSVAYVISFVSMFSAMAVYAAYTLPPA
jgi:uncharacterized protein DUF3667